jgi:hypothetical protein
LEKIQLEKKKKFCVKNCTLFTWGVGKKINFLCQKLHFIYLGRILHTSISLFISKLFCTNGEGGEGGGGGRESPPPLPKIHFVPVGEVGEGEGGPLEGVDPENQIKTHNMQLKIQNTAAAELIYIKLPMYVFNT